MRRRDLLVLGALFGSVAAGQTIWRRWPRALEFEPISALPGFRRLSRDAVRADPMLVGLDRPDAARLAARERVKAQPCDAIFGPNLGRLPVAVFTDYFCPYCPEMSAVVRDLADSESIPVTWHELPVFGRRSEQAARMALAAAEQSAHDAVHAYLMRAALPPGALGIRALADRFGLDAAQLASDAESAVVSDRLATTRAIADLAGIPGTPAVIVGRTLAVGRITNRELARLVRIEQAAGTHCGA